MKKAIVTMPPYAPFIDEVLKHPRVIGIRLNTVMPTKGKLEDLLKNINDKAESFGKEFWVDLKCRQLRVKTYGIPPFTEIELSHEIDVYTPCKAYFSDRRDSATILEVDGNRLIMQEGPNRVIGPGESVTIPHSTLAVKGYLTDLDKKYIEAGSKVGIKNYMLSFVEGKKDIEEFRKYSPDSNVVAKIESEKGLHYVNANGNKQARLMAARGDLFLEIHWPHMIIDALEKILKNDNEAIVASRIFSSLNESLEPSCEDVSDLDNLLRMGYETVMFGDDVCLKRDSIVGALNLYNAMAGRYER